MQLAAQEGVLAEARRAATSAAAQATRHKERYPIPLILPPHAGRNPAPCRSFRLATAPNENPGTMIGCPT